MHGVAAPRCGPFASTSATDMRVLTLAGGTGAAKLIRGLATCMPQRDLTVIGNTGDDTEVWGLRVSPDLDTVMYALAGMLDVERGWGLAGETFNCLAAMATHVYRLGDAPGIGSTVKMVNQLLAGVHIAAAAEAIALGTRAGADPRVLFEVISKSAGRSWMFENRVPHMLAGDYTPLSALDIFVKDLGIVLEAGQALRFPLPLAAAAHQLFLMGAAAGLGREDDSAVVKVFEKLAGISVSGGAGAGAAARAPLRVLPRSAAAASRETPPRPRGARRSRRPPRRR